MAPFQTHARATPAPTPVGSTDTQRQRRARTSKPKVKTGCNNCKQRRIKCDERRPSCTQCVRSKKICTGYPPPARSARPFEEIRIAPKPDANGQPALTPFRGQGQVQLVPQRISNPVVPRHTTPPQTPVMQPRLPILYHPASTLPLGQQEGLYYQLFQAHTANELSGFFDNIFWTRTVLQECHSEAAIRHAVVALGALYKTLEKSSESPPSSPSEEAHPMDGAYPHWVVALNQYSNACNAIPAINSQEPGANRTRLMASVLLACFDSFIGDHQQAIRQIQTGLGLLERLRAERRRAFIPRPEEPVEDELMQMFTRLAIQAKSYDMAFHFPQPYVIRLLPQSSDPSSPPSDAGSPVSTHQEPIPDRFASLIDARLAWDTLCERIFRFTEIMFQLANGPPMILPASMKANGLDFSAQIQAWSEAFEPLLASRTAPGVTSQEKAGIAVLKMFHTMGHILFMMTFSATEMTFDSFLPRFKEIVDLALEVVGDEERRAAEKRCPDPSFCQHHKSHTFDIFGGHEYAARHIKPSFSADLGIVPPLYVVATKCRDPIIRRQAIQLLRSSARREGMWDSELVARIGMWVMEIEEEDDPLTPGDSPVATTSRPSTGGGRPNGSIDFGEMPLGPGGNARWDARRGSQASGLAARGQRKTIPAEKRVLIKACEFDLREHTATLQCGTRGLAAGAPDMRTRVTRIAW